MRRDCQRSDAYWERWINSHESYIAEPVEQIKISPETQCDKDRASNLFSSARDHWHLMLLRYSRGDAISDLAQYFPGLLTYWEHSNRTFIELGQANSDRGRWDRSFLNWYQTSFQLVGLALTLNIPDDQWQRLLAIIDNEGRDILLDRIIATRQPGRKIGTTFCHPKPYALLLEAIDAPPKQQAHKLATFVNNWYRKLKRRDPADGPYWYDYHEDSDDWGTYFGYWCIEAVAAVKAFGLDDSLCLGHPHYPGDLLRPEGPTTHLPCSESMLAEALEKPKLEDKKEQQGSWISRWYHGLRVEVMEALGQGKQVRKGKNK